ncbi:O-antigen ligase family protein [Bradyrhizobium sp. Pa8]|uniref:O-antigen ligase family protein n=1 Tax=Bradyrhizobium sp. Pa8 TaxID=3386552 RepID=UPI00403F21E7
MSALLSTADRLPLVESRNTAAVRWLTIALVATIFLGNVHFVISFPVAIIPAICLLAIDRPSIPVGACMLGLLTLPLLGQSLSTPLQDRTDLVLYLPFLYAVICASAVRPLTRDQDLFAALMAGGIALSAMMLVSLADGIYKQPPLSLSMLKTLIDTPLGIGNYLATFLVFLLNVALHCRARRLAVLFAVLALATFSRTGVVMIAASLAFRMLATRLDHRQLVIALCGFFAASLVACVVIYTAAAAWLTDPTELGSTGIRLMMWRDAMDAIAYHPITGAPRSWYVRHLNFGYAWDFSFGAWNPHNFILAAWMLFGIVGAVAFPTFLFVAIKPVAERARASATWRGILIGLVIFVAWGLFEDLLFNAAALILVATLYGLARTPRAAPKATAAFVVAGAVATLATGWIDGARIFQNPQVSPSKVIFQFADGWRNYENINWSDGDWSSIDAQFQDMPERARFAVFTINTKGFLSDQYKYEQRVSVYLDDVLLSNARIRSSDAALFRIFIPTERINHRRTITLKFRSWTPTEAGDIGMDADLGRLAFAITGIGSEFLQ